VGQILDWLSSSAVDFKIVVGLFSLNEYGGIPVIKIRRNKKCFQKK
jgi:hypothetical protein